MSPEIITTIVAVFGAVATVFGGLFAVNHRLEARINMHFDTIDEKFEKLESKMSEQFAEVRTDIVDLRVAIARLEGPEKKLIQAR